VPELRLSKLPDRTPVKISISVPPELHAALAAYADTYQAAYGSAESIAELIPYMVAAFIESDNGFKKARRDRQAASGGTERSSTTARHGRAVTASRVSSPDPKGSN
jgi:hypothetical protein